MHFTHAGQCYTRCNECGMVGREGWAHAHSRDVDGHEYGHDRERHESMNPRRGDHVTVVDRLTGITSPGVVDSINPFGFRVVPALMLSGNRWYDFATEGELWIRGHYTASEPELLALRAAYALSVH